MKGSILDNKYNLEDMIDYEYLLFDIDGRKYAYENNFEALYKYSLILDYNIFFSKFTKREWDGTEVIDTDRINNEHSDIVDEFDELLEELFIVDKLCENYIIDLSMINNFLSHHYFRSLTYTPPKTSHRFTTFNLRNDFIVISNLYKEKYNSNILDISIYEALSFIMMCAISDTTLTNVISARSSMYDIVSSDNTDSKRYKDDVLNRYQQFAVKDLDGGIINGDTYYIEFKDNS